VAAIATYLTLAGVIGIRTPGLQYDEAIFEHGAVHLLTSRDAPRFAHNTATWIRIGDRHVPLMVLPYIGSATFFLDALPFALFGASAATARMVNLLLGAAGIWGVGRFGQSQLGPRLGTALALVLAIHPGYLTWTMYDNAGVSIWMAALGIVCLAALRYTERFDPASAFLLGACVGLAVWCRANYVWLLTGVLVGLAIVLRAQLLRTMSHWPALIAGGVAGSMPLIAYEFASDLGTLRFVRDASDGASRLQLVSARLAMGAQALVYDAHRRGIWAGPELPGWHMLFFAALLVVSALACLLAGGENHARARIHRIAGLALVLTVGLTLASPIRLTPAHFVVYLPLAAFVVLAAVQSATARWRAARFVVLAVGVAYAVVALFWDARTAIGIRETGGTGMWSDAVFAVAETIETRHRGRTIGILDWGLANNLYVLTSGSFRPRELFWGATSERTGLGTTWAEEVSGGGVYLLNGESNTFNKDTREAFRRAVGQSGLSYSKTDFRQRDGRVHAELYEVSPRPPGPERDRAGGHPEPRARRIVQLFPDKVLIGQPFNKQVDGSSALAIRGEGFSLTDRIFWNGRELVTAFGSSALLTAVVPDALLRSPGPVNVEVRDASRPDTNGPSATLTIER
jgi:hypothetical protein